MSLSAVEAVQDLAKAILSIKEEINLKVEGASQVTSQTLDSLAGKIARIDLGRKSAKTVFSTNERFLLGKLSERGDLARLMRMVEIKQYLINHTNLVTVATQGKTPDAVELFKSNKSTYQIVGGKPTKNETAMARDWHAYQAGENLTEYGYFCQLAEAVKQPLENSYRWEKEVERYFGREAFVHGYDSGGAEGGGYKEGQVAHSYTLAPPSDYRSTDFTEITEILKRVAPQITFLTYKDLEKAMATLVKEEELQDRSDYYGNYANMVFHGLSYQNAFQALKAIGLDFHPVEVTQADHQASQAGGKQGKPKQNKPK